MTQELLQDAIFADLKALFEHSRRKNSLGFERAVQVYPQDVPIREGDDEELDKEAPPEPYVVVRLIGGEMGNENAQHIIKIVLVICVQDPDPNRQGYRDALHITNEIYQHYAINRVVGKKFILNYPIEWTTQDDDTHPYYFTAMSLNFEASAVREEVPYT